MVLAGLLQCFSRLGFLEWASLLAAAVLELRRPIGRARERAWEKVWTTQRLLPTMHNKSRRLSNF
jgi:hypothetical protein